MKQKDQLLEDIYQYRKAIILLSAAETGLFEYLHDKGTATVKGLADHFQWNARATEIFLNALTALGYLQKNHGNYSLSDRLIEQDHPGEFSLLREWMMHEWRLLHRWMHLPEVLRSGLPYREPEKKTVHRNHRNFILSMAHREKQNVKSLLSEIDLTGCRRLLDLGGGPGLFAVAFAEKYPDLQATVFDTPETEPIALDFFQKSKVTNKLKFMGGDFLNDDFGRNYDVVLLSSILHIYGPAENIALLQRVNNALKAPGKIIIRDFGLNKDKISPEIGVLFAVNMLINTDRGNSYSYDEMKSWLNETGFGHVRRKTLDGRMMLIEARKK